MHSCMNKSIHKFCDCGGLTRFPSQISGSGTMSKMFGGEEEGGGGGGGRTQFPVTPEC